MFNESTNRYFKPSNYEFSKNNNFTIKNVYNVAKSLMIDNAEKNEIDNEKKQIKYFPRYFDQMSEAQ